MIHAKEETPLVGHKLKTYKRRWLILLYVCCINIVILSGWNMWGTIAQTMIYGYGWGNATIANILNIGRSGILAFLIPLNYVLDTKGLRPAILAASSVCLSSYALRCFINIDTSVWLAMVSEVVIGVATCFTYSGPSKMSVTWFPPDERVTATSLAVLCNYFAFAIGYILHPRVVSGPVFGKLTDVEQQYNLSSPCNFSDHDLECHVFNTTAGITVLNKAEMQTETKTLIYTETGIVAFLWLVGILFLPKSPPTPPSVSASALRLNYKHVFIEISRNGYLILLVLYGGALVGVYATWIAVIDIAFEPLGVSQTEAGTISFYSIIAGGGVGFISARFSDVLRRKLKFIQILMLTIASLSFLWLSLLCGKFINFSIEGIIIGLSAVFTSIFGLIYLLPISVVSMTDTSWLEWTLCGMGILGVIVIAITPQRYGRADIDVAVDERRHKDHDRRNSNAENDKLILH